MATAVEPLSLDALKDMVVEPLAEMLRRGEARKLELNGQIEALRQERQAVDAELIPARATLKRFAPDHELLPKPAKAKSNGNGRVATPPPERLKLARDLLAKHGQITQAGLQAAFSEEFGLAPHNSTPAATVLGWMRGHEEIRKAGTSPRPPQGGRGSTLYKPMLNGDD